MLGVHVSGFLCVTMCLTVHLCMGVHVSGLLCVTTKLRPIMLKNLPIMLLSIAQKNSPLCSKLCPRNSVMLMQYNVNFYMLQYKFNTLYTIFTVTLFICSYIAASGMLRYNLAMSGLVVYQKC